MIAGEAEAAPAAAPPSRVKQRRKGPRQPNPLSIRKKAKKQPGQGPAEQQAAEGTGTSRDAKRRRRRRSGGGASAAAAE